MAIIFNIFAFFKKLLSIIYDNFDNNFKFFIIKILKLIYFLFFINNRYNFQYF